jgi:alkanesulfonate monooxygenase SsuD/methylene tetrahydromethanopterin reductase-like flavin-dependent oxidoreductase (luciferase family)
VLLRIAFDEPVPLYRVAGQPELGIRRIRDVHEGRAALFRYGIERLRASPSHQNRAIWTEAEAALLGAARDPQPPVVEQARRALERAARHADVLAPVPSYGQNIDRELDALSDRAAAAHAALITFCR